MKVHIGKIVTKLLRDKGIKNSEFAVSMNYSKQNINTLLLKDNWYVTQIWDASIILKYNLFSFYSSDNAFKQFESMTISYQEKIIKMDEKIIFLQTQNQLLTNSIEDKEKIIALLSTHTKK